MFYLLSKLLLWIIGWKFTRKPDKSLQKFIMVIAPHTSMWDFVLGRIFFSVLQLRPRFMIKKEMFWFPLGPIIRFMGGIPVDRKNNKNLVNTIAGKLRERERMVLVITPEGTRKPTSHWKKGFYTIAERAHVPIALGYLDYVKKECGVGPVFFPSGNFEQDFEMITAFFSDKTGKHPERFNLTPKAMHHPLKELRKSRKKKINNR
ncbi:MAG: 1-acyl-sn-glycerol-3-phosphate acyltransferase [Bacteroidales bacterium]|nr:1-acyl-sn-glycerol-3-phosphate acyltransferase [Bacteroidales bacterium]